MLKIVRYVPTTHGEALALILLRVRSVDPFYPPVEAGDSLISIREWLDAEEALARWVAIVDNKIVGHVQVNKPHAYLDSFVKALNHPSVFEIARLFVTPDGRSLGVGQELLTVVRDYSRLHKAQVILAVVEESQAAYRLYKRNNMIQVGSFIGDHGLNNVFVDI